MNKKTLIHLGLIIVLCIVVYGNTFQNEFVWDEQVFIVDNMEIREINFGKFFSEDVFGIYRPLRTVWYAVSYKFWGLNPFGYHLNSLLFHVLIAVLVYFIVKDISKKRVVALISSLLFGAHPIHTERVTNMTGGFDLLGIVLMLGSFYLYIKWRENKHKGFIIGSVTLFLLALFASEEAITLPIILLLYELCFNEKKELKKYLSAAYYFLPLFFYILVRFFLLGIKARSSTYHGGSLYITLINMSKVVVGYITKLILPVNLKLYPYVEMSKSIFDLKIIGSIIVLGVVAGLGLYLYKKSKIGCFSVGFFFITLGPFYNILPLQIMMAERYLYLPSLGFCVLVGLVLEKLYKVRKNVHSTFRVNAQSVASPESSEIPFCPRGLHSVLCTFFKKNVFYAVLMIVLVSFSYQTIDRNMDWRDNFVLWSKTVEDSPHSAIAQTNLGFSYEREGDFDNALIHYKKAIELDPEHDKAYYNVGVILSKRNDYENALEYFNKAIEIDDGYSKAFTSRGLVYYSIGELDLAIKDYNEAIRLDPYDYKAYNNLGLAYAQKGELKKGIENLNKAIQINPNYGEAYYNVGIIYGHLGKNEDAKRMFEIAKRLDSKFSKNTKV